MLPFSLSSFHLSAHKAIWIGMGACLWVSEAMRRLLLRAWPRNEVIVNWDVKEISIGGKEQVQKHSLALTLKVNER